MKHLKINQAVAILKQGGVVAFPTETVYGLGAAAENVAGLKKIFSVKKRPENHPLIVHVADISELSHWANDVSAYALALAHAFWPGPLTLILKKAPWVSDLVTGQQETIGIRIPSHPIAQALLKAYGSGIAAPSANRFGKLSPTTAAAVYEELGTEVDLILEGGQCDVGVESTIVDVTGDDPMILRPGMITAEQIYQAVQRRVVTQKTHVPRVSGSMISHYAPETPIRIVSSDQLLAILQQQVCAALVRTMPTICLPYIEYRVMSSDPVVYARDLYNVLRTLDKKNYAAIFIEEVPTGSSWDAIRDRLSRASS